MSRVLLFLVLGAVLAVWGTQDVARARVRKHGAHVIAWRWLTGNSWHGKPVTDAGWTRPGVKALTRTGHATRFWHLPRWKRAGIRLGVSGGVVALMAGWVADRQVTADVVLGSAGAAAVGCCVWMVRVVLAGKHRKTWLHPLHLAVHEIAGIPRAQSAGSWITYDLEAKRVTLRLPQGFPADEKDKQRLISIATTKLGIENPKPEWKLAGPKPVLMIAPGVPSPGVVRFPEVREAIEASRANEIVLGRGQGGVTITASQTLDSPHWGVSAESGAGKSVTCRAIIAQHLHKGGIVAIVDAPKRFSHQWCKGLPSVSYARTPAEAHDLLIWLQGEADRRNQVADVTADLEGNVTVKFDRIMFVVEEINALAKRLAAYWKQSGGYGRSPAIDALEELLFLGRQVAFNGLLVGQRLSAKAVGSGDSRENVGVKILMNPSSSTWKMLADRFAQPPPDNTKGRAQVVIDEVRECQVVWFTAVEAREFSMSGIVTPCPRGMPGVSGVPGLIPIDVAGSDQVFVPGTRPVVLTPGGEVTLLEAVRQGVAPFSLAAVRKHAQRDPAFPVRAGMRGQAGVWDALELSDYYEARS